MVLNIISTVNGMENEGMRNIASHMTREIDGMCTVRHSALGNPIQCLGNSVGADAVLIFARASAKTAYLASVLRLICKHVYFILVQKPEPAFMNKVGNKAGRYKYFTILPKDGEELEALGAVVKSLSVGINSEKFRPAESREEVSALRQKYGFSDDLPLVLHVGHLSKGRGLEEFLHLPKEKYQRLVVASGMFNSDDVEKKLTSDGVRILKEYLPDVSEVYRMADVYLFPTRSAEFVISIPLSITEALACGVPVVSFRGVDGISMINSASAEALLTIDDDSELENAVFAAVEAFNGERRNLLSGMGTWNDAARKLFEDITGDL